MIGLLISAVIASTVGFGLMPLTIRRLRERGIGQFIQEDVEGHAHKHGTPTMGGLVIILAALIGYLVAHLRIWVPGEGFT
ncbi:MAG: phospho-N-acetylmuramoyl-pentapeptide-transferase, partial [Acidimicrobiia bacterium]|nr:phospho-N-acetylmuramoyl-pentapeptide-transferase [Acidimicrobiia bacterium]NNL27282.1 phospho-N-acetylmuramoyl-pentapeptide-transferase [Acidimicrobiia bacterium]